MGYDSKTCFDESKARIIAEGLYGQLDADRLERTGRIAPFSDLRSLKGRQAFAWTRDPAVHSNRFFTNKAVRRGIELLLAEYGVQPPDHIPGFNLKSWLDAETTKLGSLCRKARRCSAEAMDPSNAETQAWDAED